MTPSNPKFRTEFIYGNGCIILLRVKSIENEVFRSCEKNNMTIQNYKYRRKRHKETKSYAL